MQFEPTRGATVETIDPREREDQLCFAVVQHRAGCSIRQIEAGARHGKPPNRLGPIHRDRWSPEPRVRGSRRIVARATSILLHKAFDCRGLDPKLDFRGSRWTMDP